MLVVVLEGDSGGGIGKGGFGVLVGGCGGFGGVLVGLGGFGGVLVGPKGGSGFGVVEGATGGGIKNCAKIFGRLGNLLEKAVFVSEKTTKPARTRIPVKLDIKNLCFIDARGPYII